MGIGKEYEWFKPDICRVSQYNQCDSVRHTMPNLPKKAFLRDITIKAGANHEVGCVLELDTILPYIEKLVEARVPELDCGRCYSAFDMALMKRVKEAGLDITLCPSVGEYDMPGEVLDVDHYRKFVDLCFENGANEVKLLWESGSMQPPLTRSPTNMLRGLETILYIIEYVHSQYQARVSVSTADNVRLPMDTQLYFHRKLVEADVDRVWISDEGHTNPSAFKYVVKRFREELGDEISFAFHVHNCWGLGMANMIAGAEEGGPAPIYLDVALDGIGLAQPLDEVALALEFLYGVDTGMKLNELYSLCQVGRKVTKTIPARSKPHTGETTLIEAAGSIVTGLKPAHAKHLDDRVGVFHPGGLNPEIFGAIGGKTAWWGEISVDLITDALKYLKLNSDEKSAKKVIDVIVRKYQEKNKNGMRRGYILWEEFVDLAKSTTA